MKPPPLYHLVDLWISLTRYLHEAADDAPSRERFGAQAGDLLIRAAIYLGTMEGHPMTPAKLADHIGIPRPTIVRRLRVLERRGVVVKCGRAWRTPDDLLARRHQHDFSAGFQMVRRVNDKLKK